MAAITESRSEHVDLRMTPTVKQALQRAATIANKTLTEFMLDRALEAAYQTLADRRVFMLDEAQWAELMSRLDAPPADNPRPNALLAHRPAWET